MIMRWAKSWILEQTYYSSWVPAVETEVTNAYLQIQQFFESRDHAQMHINVVHLLRSIVKHKKGIISLGCHYFETHQQSILVGTDERFGVSDVVEQLLDPLLENMNHLISRFSAHPPKDQLQVIEGKLTFLRNCLQIRTLCEWRVDVLKMVVIVSENALFACYISWLDAQTLHLNIIVADVLVKIEFIVPLARLACSGGPGGSILGTVDSLLADVRAWMEGEGEGEQIRALYYSLVILKDFLMYPPQNDYSGLNHLFTQITSLADQVSIPHINSQTEDPALSEKSDVVITDLFNCLNNTVNRIKADFTPQNTSWFFPRTPNASSVDFFLQNLEELLHDRANVLDCVEGDAETILRGLQKLRSFLGEKNVGVSGLKGIVERVVNVAYKAEFLIDSITAGSPPRWFHILSLSNVVQEINLLQIEASQILTDQIFPITDEEENSMATISMGMHFPDDEVVGFVEEAGRISNRLQRGSKCLDIVSIVGMPGLGKTSLARKLYKSPTTTSYFPIRSWCCISQVYTKRRLLLDILGDVIEVDEIKVKRMRDQDLAELLCRSLKGRRYLVVLDDIWGVDAWNDIRYCFPDQANGSRILLTSRSGLVSLEIKPNGAPFNLRMFSKEESWELLQKKVFGGRSCPRKLSIIGERIAEYCRGLPLSVVMVAGILKDIGQTIDEWNVIAESVKKHSFDEDKKVMGVLELSYQHLPDHLKPCFLYFGIFPEDREISVQKLVSLWIAEGLVLKIKGKNAEDVGEDYVKELVGRNMVAIAKRKSKGGIKACNIHDLLLQFCLDKGEKENFLIVSHGNEAAFTCWNGPHPESHYMSREEPQRLCIHAGLKDVFEWRPYNYPHTRSLLFFATSPASFNRQTSLLNYVNDFSFLAKSTKLVRVLDFSQFNFEYGFLHEVEFLVHLRYIAIRGSITSVPSSIVNLLNLETLQVKGVQSEVSVTRNIWKMRRLRHLLIRDLAAFESFKRGDDNTFAAFDIESIATPSLCFPDYFTRDILTKLPRLRKLRCVFLEWCEVHKGFRKYKSPALDCLRELESLKVVYHGSVRCNFRELNLPQKADFIQVPSSLECDFADRESAKPGGAQVAVQIL